MGYRKLTSGSLTWHDDVVNASEKGAYVCTIPAQDHAAVWKETLRYNILYDAGGFGRDASVVSEADMLSILSTLKWSDHGDSSRDALLACLDNEIDPTRLSSGEKQRLLLARALLSGKDTLFMDEGMSALPPDVDAIVWPQLRERFRTIVLVSHQWRDVARGDYLIGMENGTVFEAGTIAELVVKDHSLLDHCFHSDQGFYVTSEEVYSKASAARPAEVPPASVFIV